MAEVNLKIKVEAGKDFFHFYDKTGSYDKHKNPHGWNGPNRNISTVTNAVVRVYLPNGQETYTEVVVFPNLPRVDCVGMEIIPADISLEYVITFQDGYMIAESIYFFHSEPLCCCIQKKRGRTSLFDASSDEAKKVIELEVLTDNAQWAACIGDMETAQKITDMVWTKCGCCC
jgi:hypothetical protein